MTYYIYALHSGDHNYRYVGKTNNPQDRLRRHKNAIREHPDWPVYVWAAQVPAIYLEILEEYEDSSIATQAEWEMMAALEDQGYELTNSSGKRGVREPSATYSVNASAAKSGENNPAFGKPAYNRGVPLSEEAKRKFRATRKERPWASGAKLTEEQVCEIYLSNQRPSELAALYGVTTDAVANIRSGRSWRNVTAGLIRVANGR